MNPKLQKLGTIAYMIVMVFYGVYTMVLSIQAYSKFSDTTQTYMNMAQNLGNTFVTDVEVNTSGCSSGYSSIIGWNWEGSNAGCDCTSSSYSSGHNSYYSGACNSTEIGYGCTTLDAISGAQFNTIEGVTNNKQYVCIKRGTVKFSDIAQQQTGSCTSSQKTCGSSSTPGSVICVGLSESCPIYSIKMSNTVDTTTYPSSEWTQLSLASGKYLYYNKNGLTQTTLPSSEFRFTQTGVCKLANQAKTLPSGASDYLLVKTKRDSCSDIDSTFVVTNLQVAENKYYQINLPSADWTKMQSWPSYAVPTSTEAFKSYQRNFINWKISARDLLKDFVDSADSMNTLKTAQLVVMIINILVCIAVSIVLQVSQVYNLCGKDVPCISGEGEDEQRRIVFIKKILTYGSKLVQTPFLLWAFIISLQKKDIMNKAANSAPSDARFNSEMAAFADQLESDVYQKNLIALIILLLTVVLDIVLYLKARYSKKTPGNATVEPAKQDEEVDLKQGNNNFNPTPQQTQNNINQQQEFQSFNQPVVQQQYVAQPQQPIYAQQQPQPVFSQPYQQQPNMYGSQQPIVIVQGVPQQPIQQQPVIVYQQY